MDKTQIKKLLGFYENELVNNILFFWDEKCADNVNGGFFNCFDNRGENLVSRDKYTWSQGRFVWLWSKLAAMDCGTFTEAQRAKFLANAKHGKDFLAKHCLLGKDDWRCIFLLDEAGNPKTLEGHGDRLDLSISADEFVVTGFSRYARTANDKEAYQFAKNLYQSIKKRFDALDYMSLPYPMPKKYRSHGSPMGFINVSYEMYRAACIHEPEWADTPKGIMKAYVDDILDNFVDDQFVLREVIARADNSHLPSVLGQHVNPGHVLEDMWFMVQATDVFAKDEYLPKIAAVARKTLEIGWDNEFGGMLHFVGVNGGKPEGQLEPDAEEPMLKLVQRSWDDKLWWIHSESLYTTLLMYERTGDELFMDWHDKVFDYAYTYHANPNREVREWVQILTRDGQSQEKVVALPVKDPYHIMRNMIYIIELLYKMLG